jgi:hypothetical protein
MPSSIEWHWMTEPALSVQLSPIVTSVRSAMEHPSSNGCSQGKPNTRHQRVVN